VSGGATFILEDRAGKDIAFLAENTTKFLEAAKKRPELASVSTTFRPTVPQLFIDVDQDKVLKQGVNLSDVYKTLQSFLGSGFINYFNRFGRQWQVYVQAEGDYRTNIENVGQFYVRNNKGEAVPLSALTSIRNISGPEFTMRYNLYRSAQINASAAPGYSSTQVMRALEEVFAETMPSEMGYDYLGMSFQEQRAQQGVSPAVIFGFSLLCVFLILAAQYESWSLPFSVLLGTPIAVAGAFFALLLRGQELNVYAQIGLVMLIGLAAKNAILIVEFAKMEYEKGELSLAEATLKGAQLRLRPILMTSFAFILGCVPLAIASGAGAISRQVMGSAVIGGMLAATCIAIFIIPVTFYVVEKISHKGDTGVGHHDGESAAAPPRVPQHRLLERRGIAMRKPLLAALLALLVGGCMVGPDYVRPPIDTPTAWRLSDQDARDLANTAWWEQFGDPVLNELVSAALLANKDLLIASARIEEFAGQYGFVRSALFPQVGAGYEVSRQKGVASGRIDLIDLQQLSGGAQCQLGDRHLGPHSPPDRGGEGTAPGQRGRPASGHPLSGRQRCRCLRQPPRPRSPVGNRQGDSQKPRGIVRDLQGALRGWHHLAA
jgi:hypothetical protein